MTLDDLSKARKAFEIIKASDNITAQSHMAALWASLHGEHLLAFAEEHIIKNAPPWDDDSKDHDS